MPHPVYKDLVDNVQGFTVTNVDLIGTDDVTVELQLTFNNGIMLSVRSEKDRVYGPVIQTETRRIVAQRMIDDTAARVVSTYPEPQPAQVVRTGSRFCTDTEEIENLFRAADDRWPNHTFVASVREQYQNTRRLTWNQVEALNNIICAKRR